jgi:hypothetical protein
MKNYYQQLCDTPIELLDKLIVRQKAEIAVRQRDLAWMEGARAVRLEQQAMADIERKLKLSNKLACINARLIKVTSEEMEREDQATSDMLSIEDE